MTIFDKRISKEKRESLELAEESRQKEWMFPSFVSRLFQGALEWGLIHPYPEQDKDEKEKGDRLLKNLEEFLKNNIDPDKVDETGEIPEVAIKGLFDMGIFSIKIPEEYGGLGMSQTNFSRVIHMLGTYCGSTTAMVSAHQSIGVPQPLILFGTKEQKEKYLPMFRKGAISGFALTEPGAGSDPRLIKTTATPVEDGRYYLLNGEKLWCTNGNIADLLVVMALTPSKDKDRKGITAFIVETKTPGFEVAYRCKFMGLGGIQNGLLRFNNVKVPRENIIMGEGEGLKLAYITLNTGRLTLPALVTGASKWCLHVARRWAKERRQWGAAIGEHEAVAAKLSYMAGAIFAMDAVTWLVASMADNERFDIRLEAAMTKLFCTEEAWKIVNEAVQIRGGSGYETGPSLKGRGRESFPLERALRDLRVNTILEGTSEIMHLFIAREALDFHLEKVKTLFDPKALAGDKIRAALSAGIKYALWYPKMWLPCLCGGRDVESKKLKRHILYIRKTSRRLARGIFHKMAIYQKRLVDKQNTINRFVDIGTYLFAMSCACSYADTLYKNDTAKRNSVELADLFCQQASVRIGELFGEVNHNADRLSGKVSKGVLSSEYAWLEDNVIK